MKANALLFSVHAIMALAMMPGQVGAQPAISVIPIKTVSEAGLGAGLVRKVHTRNKWHCHGKGANRRCHGPRRTRGSHSG